MNKFQIGKRYNEQGKSDPVGFLKWLLTNLPARLKGRGFSVFIKNIISYLKSFDVADWWSRHKINTPWDKKENMVKPGYYRDEKTKAMDKEFSNLFSAMGMEESIYFDPEMIAKAEVVESFINMTFGRNLENNPLDERSAEYKQFISKWEEAVESVDIGKNNYTFSCKIADKDHSFAIITKDELANILADAGLTEAPFLATKDTFTKNSTEYVVIDADNEKFKKIMVERLMNRDVPEEELTAEDPSSEQQREEQWQAPEFNETEKEPEPEKEASSQDKSEKKAPEKTEPVKNVQSNIPKLGFKKIPRIDAVREDGQPKHLLDDVRATYDAFVKELSPADKAKTYVKIRAYADKVHAGKASAIGKSTLIQIPYTNKDPQLALYLKFPKDDKIHGDNRVKTDKQGNRYIVFNMSETFPLFDAKGDPVIGADGFQAMITVDQLVSSHFLLQHKATGLDLSEAFEAPEIPEPPHQEPIAEIKDGVLKFVGDSDRPMTDKDIPEGTQLTSIDFNHKNVSVAAGAINDMPSLTSIVNAENVQFAEGAVTGCPLSLEEMLSAASFESQEPSLEHEPEDTKKSPEKEDFNSNKPDKEPDKEQTKKPTAYAKQQLFAMDGQTR